MNTILVTGASGFIASNFIRSLYKHENIHIFLKPKTNNWRIKDILSDLTVHYVDITEKSTVEQVIKKINPQYVFHFASYGVSRNQTDVLKFFNTNVLGTINLLNAFHENNELKQFVNIGSVFEYGESTGKTNELKQTNPSTLYGISKLSQSLLSEYYFSKGIPCITVRLFTPYGKYDSIGRLISDVMISILKKKPIVLSSSNTSRDFIFIDDVIQFLKFVIKKPILQYETIDIGSGKLCTVNELVKTALQITDLHIDVDYKNSQFDNDKSTVYGFADITNAKKLFDWSPSTSLEMGLRMSFDWYNSHIDLYDEIKYS